jgi:hypothetical protein
LLLQIISELDQFVPAARYQNQVAVIACEELGEFISDAAGSPGDESGLVCHDSGL